MSSTTIILQLSTVLAAIFALVSGQFCPNPDSTLSTSYDNCTVLSSDNYELYWTYVHNESRSISQKFALPFVFVQQDGLDWVSRPTVACKTRTSP